MLENGLLLELFKNLQTAVARSPDAGRDLALTAALRGRHPAEIALALRELHPAEALAVFNVLDNARAAEVLEAVDGELRDYLLAHSAPERLAELLDRLPMDDAAAVIGEAPAGQSAALLRALERRDPAEAADVQTLLAYPENSAGRLMTDKYASVGVSAMVGEALATVRRQADRVETVDSVYVLDAEGRLCGVCPLRRLLAAADNQPVTAAMVGEPISVPPEADREEVARLSRRYDLSAIPVVDADRRLLGIVTVDDVLDVLVAEFNEDYFKLAGTDAEAMERRTPLQVARLRLPSLLLTMAIELAAGGVIAHFDEVLKEVILLASFMPVISAISGNVGLQAAAIVVRGLDTGHVRLGTWWRQVRKEATTGLLMALSCGAVLGCVGALWSQHLPFGIVIGIALTCAMLTAGFMGTVIPLLSKRLGFDPATTAGPFETAFQDVIGFAVFLSLAAQLLQWLR